MALLAAHDETTLAAYMAGVIGPGMAAHLSWSVGESSGAGDYQKPVDDVLRLYGVDAISEASDPRRLERLATVAVWQAVVDELVVTDFSVSVAGGVSMTRSQRIANAERRLAQALSRLQPGDIVSGASVVRAIPIAYDDRFAPRTETGAW